MPNATEIARVIKYYESYFVVKDEDKKELFTLPNGGYKDEFTIYRANKSV